MTSCTSADGTLNYSYDADGQLIGVATNGTTTATYNWDANGNPSNFDANGNPAGTSYVIGNDNELLYDGTYRYAYDGEGNCVLRFKDPGDIDTIPTGSNGDTDITVYQWDARGRLSEAVEYPTYSAYNTTGPTEIIDYLYDTENRWIGENICNGDGLIEHETRFAYDGNQIILQFDKDFATPVDPTSSAAIMTNANLTHRYLWQPNAVDQLMADEQVTDPSAPGNVVYPLADQEGTIHDLAVATLNSSTGLMNATVVNHIVYDAFGNVVSSTNPSSLPTVTCLFGFTGRPTDPATGLQNNGNRWYSPQAMRWMSQDPLGYDGGDTNLYRYCGNSVTNTVDPTGLRPWGWPEEQVMIMWCAGNPELIRKVQLLFDVLDKTSVPWGTNGCHRWADEFERLYRQLAPGDRLGYQRLYPICDVWYMPFWGEHSVIKLNINGLNVYLDNWFQGGMSHISFKEKSDLIYPNDPRYDPIMNARTRAIQAAAKARANNHFLDGPWTPCFREGTPVHTDGGPRNIEAVSVGTMVWSYDHERESWALMPVSHIEAHDFAGAMVTITVGNDTIAATLAHPFWVVSGECLESRPLARSRDGANRASSENGRWVSAGELRRGDTLLARGGRLIAVGSRDTCERNMRVYNLRVDRNNNYTVGKAGLLVNNM